MLTNLSLAKKFALSFSALIVVSLIVSVSAFISFLELEKADAWNTHTHNVLDKSSTMIAAIVDQETGVRGFLVSGDENFLEPYHAGKKTFNDMLSQLLALTSDNAAQQARLKTIQSGAESWHRDVVDPEIALGKNPETLEEARAIEASGAGKAMMDAIRGSYAEFMTAERSLLVTRSVSKKTTMWFAETILVVGSVIILILATGLGFFLSRNIGGAVTQMTKTMGELADGNNAIEIPYRNRQDEIGSMATAVQMFKDNAIRNEELLKEQGHLKEQADVERHLAQEEAIEAERAVVVGSFGTALLNIANKDLSYRMTQDLPIAY